MAKTETVDVAPGGTARFKLSLEQLGAPSSNRILESTPNFADPNGGEPRPRTVSSERRLFEVKGKITRTANVAEIDSSYGSEDGSSYLKCPKDAVFVEISHELGDFRFHKNGANEISMASSEVLASDAIEARYNFENVVSVLVDRLAYISEAPMYLGSTVVDDPSTGSQTLFFVAPPRQRVLEERRIILDNELIPVYALYREALNSSSPYYRVLCFFKIMEGLLGPLEKSLAEKAKESGGTYEIPQACVPDHPDIADALRHLVGKQIKHVRKTFLRKEFRNAMAHFVVDDYKPLNVSISENQSRFVDVAFVASLCARILIDRHQMALTTINGEYQGVTIISEA